MVYFNRSSRSSPPPYIPTRKVRPTRVDGSGDSRELEFVGLVSKSKREASKHRAYMDEQDVPSRKCIKREKDSDPIVNLVIEAEKDEKKSGLEKVRKRCSF